MCTYFFLISHDIRLHLCHLFKVNFGYPCFQKDFRCVSHSVSSSPLPLFLTHINTLLDFKDPVFSPFLPTSFAAAQSLSNVWPFATPGTAAYQASLSLTLSLSLLKFMSIESVILYNLLIFCRPLLLWPSVFPSIRVFSNELALRIR